MEVTEEMLNDLITAAERFKAVGFSIRLGEYKGWNVRVSIEQPREDEKETKK